MIVTEENLSDRGNSRPQLEFSSLNRSNKNENARRISVPQYLQDMIYFWLRAYLNWYSWSKILTRSEAVCQNTRSNGNLVKIIDGRVPGSVTALQSATLFSNTSPASKFAKDKGVMFNFETLLLLLRTHLLLPTNIQLDPLLFVFVTPSPQLYFGTPEY